MPNPDAYAEAAKAVPQLTAALSNEQLVGHAANALAKIGPKAASAVPALAQILAAHESVDYRCAALNALGRIGTNDAPVAVRAGLNDRRKEVRNAARTLIRAAK